MTRSEGIATYSSDAFRDSHAFSVGILDPIRGDCDGTIMPLTIIPYFNVGILDPIRGDCDIHNSLFSLIAIIVGILDPIRGDCD